MPDADDTTQASEAADQLALDDADTTAGYRAVIDDDEQLQADDPNAAACGDTHDTDDHEQYIGDDADDDSGVAAAGADLAGGGH
jgi:hypothetical protein